MKSLLWAALILLPTTVFAHGIGEVYTLPVPLRYYLLGAGITVAFSFFIIALFLIGKKNDGEWKEKSILIPGLRVFLRISRWTAIFFLALTVIAGIIGIQNALQNFTPIFFWIYLIVGMGIVSCFIGNFWDKVNPWKTITDKLYDPSDRKIPGLIGPLLILGLFWLELVSGRSFVPRVISLTLLIYTLVNLLMARYFENWYRDAELFSVLFGFIGKLAHFRISDDNSSIVTVNENKKLSGLAAPAWVLLTAGILLAGTSFDSLIETVTWYKFLDAIGSPYGSTVVSSIGLLLSPLPFILGYFLAIWVMQKITQSEHGVIELARRFVWSLIPIAFGYTLAHNFSLLTLTAPQMLPIISDPFGFGWNLFGTSTAEPAGLLLGARAVWFIEMGFIILAHVVGVLYAHILAMNIFKDPRKALRSQYPMMVLMISFTIMTLWLLSQPLVLAK